jgi:hypothetical protein
MYMRIVYIYPIEKSEIEWLIAYSIMPLKKINRKVVNDLLRVFVLEKGRNYRDHFDLIDFTEEKRITVKARAKFLYPELYNE